MTIVDHVAVIGGGVMGSGIGQALLQGGYSVSIRDIEEDILDDARERMVSGNYGLQRAVDEGYLEQEEMNDCLDRLEMTVDIEEAVDGTNLVIEAVPEDLSLKGQVFQELDEATEPDVPLASNTSGFSIAAIANAVDDPSRVVGAHFFNPAQVMNLVEIVKTPQTDEDVTQLVEDIVNDLGKTPIVIDDSPDEYGFVANRAFGALREEAKKIVREGVATEEQVDTALEEGYNLPIGPFSMPGLGEEWD
ncbi:MAG: 3-hydroxyacyl-CoA dehydrogenase family protein [Halobacteriales archaeon]